MAKLESKDWRWFFIFCAMSVCVFIGIGGVLLAVQALIVMNMKSFFLYLCCAPFWVAGHWLVKKLW